MRYLHIDRGKLMVHGEEPTTTDPHPWWPHTRRQAKRYAVAVLIGVAYALICWAPEWLGLV